MRVLSLLLIYIWCWWGAICYHYSLLVSFSAALDGVVNMKLSRFVLILILILISAAQPHPALLPSFYIGPNQRQADRSSKQRQADRAGRDTWWSEPEIQCALCGLLFVSRPALAFGFLHWPPWGVTRNLHCKYCFTKQVSNLVFVVHVNWCCAFLRYKSFSFIFLNALGTEWVGSLESCWFCPSDNFDLFGDSFPIFSFLDHGRVKYLHVKLDCRSYGNGA